MAWTLEELQVAKEEYLAERAADHPRSTVDTDRVKIGQFLAWLADR